MSRPDFDIDETISPPTRAVVAYKAPGGGNAELVVGYVPRSVVTTRYATIYYTDPATGEQKSSEVVVEKISDNYSVLAAVNPALCKSYLENGITPNGFAVSVARTVTISEYKIGKDGPEILREIATEYLSEMDLAGKVGIQEFVVNGTPLVLNDALIPAGMMVTEYQNRPEEGIAKRLTTPYLCWGRMQEGSQLAAARAKDVESVDDLIALLVEMFQFRCDGTTVQITTSRETKPETRPSDQSNTRNNLNDAGNGSQSVTAGFDFGLPPNDGFTGTDPSATPPADPLPGTTWTDLDGNDSIWNGDDWVPITTDPPDLPDMDDIYIDPITGDEYQWDGTDWIPTDNNYGSTPDSNLDPNPNDGVPGDEIILPYPNDDVIITVPDGDGNLDDWLVPGGADEQALALAELENALRYGHAYGANIVLEVWQLPTRPLAPYTVRAGGLEVQYLADGCSWEWDSQQLVVSCDGIYAGVVGRISGETVTPWVPAVVDLNALPVVGAPTVNSTPTPANTIPTPTGFDPNQPGAIWNLLPTNGSDTYPLSTTPSYVAAPYTLREREELIARSFMVELEVPYSLAPVNEGTEALLGVAVVVDSEAVSSWQPSSLTLSAWYDASQSGDFTLSSGTVSQWNDRSGNARHLTQGTAGSRPAYASATLNSLNVVTFDGTDDFLTGSALSNYISASAFTVFAVVRVRSAGVGSGLAYENKAILMDQGQYFGLVAKAPTGASSTQVQGYNWDGDETSATEIIGSDNAWTVVTFTHGAGSIALDINGGTAVTATSGDTELLTGSLDVGRNMLSSIFQEMDVAEVGFLNTAVTLGNRQKLQGYAAHKWNLQSLLPSDHPYKASPPPA